jgi:hypothetical protein
VKTIVTLVTLGLLLMVRPAVGAISDSRSDFVMPDDAFSTTTRGSYTVCKTRPGSTGKRSLSFMQVENAACPEEPHKAVGWDRPQVEPVSPGIPFQDQGIER